GHVPLVGRRAARGACVAGGMLARRERAVAFVRRAGIPVVRAERTARALRVRRTGRARAVAYLVGVALARRSTAFRAGVAGGMLASRARAVARIRRAYVPVVGAGRRARLDGVRRAGRARAAAGFGGVARSGR